MPPSCCISADMLFQDASSYNYLSNGNLPVSGWDDAADLQDSLVSTSGIMPLLVLADVQISI